MPVCDKQIRTGGVLTDVLDSPVAFPCSQDVIRVKRHQSNVEGFIGIFIAPGVMQ
jgi:hypothetical protein